MPEIQSLTVRVLGDVTDLRRKMSKAERSVEEFGYKMKRVGKTLTAGLTLPLAAAGAAATKMASDAEEAANKFDVVMGDAAGRVRARFAELHDVIPLTTHEMEGLAAGVQDLLVPLGLARNSAADMSAQMVELAADLGSFNNVAASTVLEDFKSGLAGMSRPLRKYGVDISKARLDTLALEMGLIEAGDELDTTSRALAVMEAITRDSADAVGDAARTAGSAANQFKFFMRNVKELGVTIGKQLLPVITPLVQRINEVINGAATADGNFTRWIISISAVAAAMGPLLLIVGKLTQAFVALRIAGMSAAIVFGVGGALFAALGLIGGVLIKRKLDAMALAEETRKMGQAAADAARDVDTLTKAQLEAARAGFERAIAAREGELASLEAERDALISERDSLSARGAAGDRDAAFRALSIQQEIDALNEQIEPLKGNIEAFRERVTEVDNQLERLARGAESAAARLASAGDPRIALAGLPPGVSPEARAAAEGARALGPSGMHSARLPTDFGLPTDRVSMIGPAPDSFPDEGGGGGGGLPDQLKRLTGMFGGLLATLGPFAALVPVIKGAFDVLKPVLDKIIAPLAELGEVIGGALAPIFEALADVVDALIRPLMPLVELLLEVSLPLKILKVALEAVAWVLGGLMKAIGWLVKAIGVLLDDVLGRILPRSINRLGRHLKDAGQGMIDAGNAARDNADATEESTDAMQEASRVLNAPSGFKVALARFNATATGGSGGGGGPGLPGGGGPGRPGGPGGPVVTQDITLNVTQREDEDGVAFARRVIRALEDARSVGDANATGMTLSPAGV